jgi:hypothetical protein
MDTTTLAIVIIVAALIVGGLAWFLWMRSRSRALRESFGPEYDRAVSKAGRSEGEKLLDERRKRVAEYDLHPLAADDRVSFIRRWDEVQARFVDDPAGAISEAQHLVDELMEARGYPTGDAQRSRRTSRSKARKSSPTTGGLATSPAAMTLERLQPRTFARRSNTIERCSRLCSKAGVLVSRSRRWRQTSADRVAAGRSRASFAPCTTHSSSSTGTCGADGRLPSSPLRAMAPSAPTIA